MAEEKRFEKKLERYLAKVGVYQAGTPMQSMLMPQMGWYTKIWGGGYQKSGIPDILMCVNGLFMGVELKGLHGHPSELQLINTKAITDAGGAGIVLYPDQFELFQHLVACALEEHRIDQSLVQKINERSA